MKLTQWIYWILTLAVCNQYWDYAWYLSQTVPVPYVTAVVASLCAGGLLFLSVLARTVSFRIPGFFYGFVVYFAFCLLSGFALLQRGAPRDQWIQFGRTSVHLAFYCYFALVCFTVMRSLPMKALVGPLKFAGVATVAVALAQSFYLNALGSSPPDWLLFGTPLSEEAFGLRRAASVFPEPSWFAFSTVDLLGVAIGLYAADINRKGAIVWISLLAVGLVASNSIGGYLSLAIFTVMAALRYLRGKDRSRVLLVCLVVSILGGIAIGTIGRNTVVPRIEAILSGDDPSTHMRITSTLAALRTWLDSPIFGVGFGNGQFFTARYFESDFLLNQFNSGGFATAYASDSFWALLLAETGVVGLFGFAVLYFSILQKPLIMRSSAGNSLGYPSGERTKVEKMYTAIHCVVLMQFLQLVLQASFLNPRIWFYFALLAAIREKLQSNEGEQRKAL